MKKKEIIFIAVILLLAGGIWGYQQLTKPDSYESIRITVRGKEFGTFSLDKDQVIEINGTNVAEIKDHELMMTEALCPDHLCMYQGPINEYGGMIVCLPNEVVIEGENLVRNSLQTDAVAS